MSLDVVQGVVVVQFALLDIEEPFVGALGVVADAEPGVDQRIVDGMSGPEAWMPTNGPIDPTATTPGIPKSDSPSVT